MRCIKNNKGATLPIALVFFIVCAVIGTTILTTGTVASNRVGGLLSQQQPYYSATSAARVMKSILENSKFVCSSGSTHVSYKDGESILSDEFSNQLELAYEFLENNKGLPCKPISFKINTDNEALNITSLDSNLIVSTEEDSAYDITVNIKKEIDGNSYQCILYAPASITKTDNIVWKNKVKSIDTITTITWPNPVIKSVEVDYD